VRGGAPAACASRAPAGTPEPRALCGKAQAGATPAAPQRRHRLRCPRRTRRLARPARRGGRLAAGRRRPALQAKSMQQQMGRHARYRAPGDGRIPPPPQRGCQAARSWPWRPGGDTAARGGAERQPGSARRRRAAPAGRR
jgi:hypothetical protein